MKYIDAEKLIAEIEKEVTKWKDKTASAYSVEAEARRSEANRILVLCNSLIEQRNNMIQWTGNNLKEVIDFTGKSPRFGEWFNSWEEYENYVHTHNDILKLFCEDGSHYEVPIGAWIVKTPDGYNVPSVSRFVKHEKLVVKSKTCPKCKGTGKMLIDESYKDYHTNIRYTDIVEKSCSLCGGKGIIVQPEVDLEKEIIRYQREDMDRDTTVRDVARHFYELGLTARKEE